MTEEVKTQEAGSHHGKPTLSVSDLKLLTDQLLWINTVRAAAKKHSGKYLYDSNAWLPTTVDCLKSRLFWRIRAGKPILPDPPPTAYSCPWYEVVEDPRPHWLYDDFYELDDSFFVFSPKTNDRFVSAAQCTYKVEEKLSDSEYLVSFEPYRFRVYKGTNTVTGMNQETKQLEQTELAGWWIQRIS